MQYACRSVHLVTELNILFDTSNLQQYLKLYKLSNNIKLTSENVQKF